MSPLRVFQITNMYPSAERPNWGIFIKTQIDSLAQVGIERAGFYEIEGWRTRLHYARALWRLPQLVAAADPDLVHIHYGLSAIAAAAVRGRPLVVSFCGNDLLGCPDAQGRISRSSQVMARWCRAAARRADAIIVKSPAMAEALAGWDEVHVIPNGVDLDAFAPVPAAEARDRLGWPQGVPIALFPANPREPRKNWALAEACCARLTAQGVAVDLRWVYGRPHHEVHLAMCAADVMLNPSFHEGSPNAVKEAMAVDLPVVSADVGDCRERLAGCTPGAVVERTPEAFAAAVAAVLAAGRRSNGRACIAPLAMPAVAARVRAVYERAIARHRNRQKRAA